MQFSESWLRQFVNPNIDTQSLANLLTMAGLEVESFSRPTSDFTGVVIGLVEKVEPHPNADRLRVCQVNVGKHGILQIVCGAKNVEKGIKVPCALIGALLPSKDKDGKPFKIKLGKLRGVESFGMLCSAAELNFDSIQEGIMLLPHNAPVGSNVCEYLFEADPIFNVKLTPNRSDCLSVFGIAREISVLTGAELKGSGPNGKPVFKNDIKIPLIQEKPNLIIKTDIVSDKLCGRFCSRVILGVNAQVSTPHWIVERLASAGQRSVSILVDLSNYFLIEYGIPSHIYDLDKIQGSLVARWARKNEFLTLLNGDTIELDEDVGIVADEQGPLSLAGIMGGMSSAVSSETKNIAIEVAFWCPSAIRGRSRRYRLSTEAGHRFERGVDFSSNAEFLKYLSEFVVLLCGGQLGVLNDQIKQLPFHSELIFRTKQFQRQIGVPLSNQDCEKMLARLHFEKINKIYENEDNSCFEIIPPSYRFDLQEEIDVVGELARLYGFDSIPATLPQNNFNSHKISGNGLDIHFFRNRLSMLGYNETINYSFVDPYDELDLMSNKRPIYLINPISSEMAVMRSSLLAGLLKVIQYNLNREATRSLAFEIGRVFLKLDRSESLDADSMRMITQPMMLGGIAYGNAMNEQWGFPPRDIDFFDVKGDVESLLNSFCLRGELLFSPFNSQEIPSCFHPCRSAQIYIGKRVVGSIGELNPVYLDKYSLTKAPIFFQISIDAVPEIEMPKIQTVSRFPSVRRDIAFVVDKKITAAQLKEVLLLAIKDCTSMACRVSLFDVFVFDDKIVEASLRGKKSLAFSVVLQDFDKTLSESMIDDVLDKLVKSAELKCQARLRH